MYVHTKRRKEEEEEGKLGVTLAGEYTEFEIYPGRTNY